MLGTLVKNMGKLEFANYIIAGIQKRDDEMKTLVIDFDGTITEPTIYKPYTYGAVNKKIKASLKELYANGWRVIIWTSRSWAEKDNIVDYLNHNEIMFTQLICCKPIGDVYCDNKNITGDGLNDLVKISKI